GVQGQEIWTRIIGGKHNGMRGGQLINMHGNPRPVPPRKTTEIGRQNCPGPQYITLRRLGKYKRHVLGLHVMSIKKWFRKEGEFVHDWQHLLFDPYRCFTA